MLKKSFIFVIFMAIFWLFSMSQADVDLWGHIKFGRDELLRIHPVEMVLISKLTPTDYLMKFLSDWTIVYEDDASVLFALKGSTQEQWIKTKASETKTSGTDLFFP